MQKYFSGTKYKGGWDHVNVLDVFSPIITANEIKPLIGRSTNGIVI